MENKSILERFESKFQKTNGCWIWTGAKEKKGYGLFRLGTNNKIASRVSFVLYKGEIPKGKLVCHTCDTPSCVNPDHLFLGTHKENLEDMTKKNRRFSILNKFDIPIIRDALAEGFSCKQIAGYFKVTDTAIRRIRNNQVWLSV